MKVLFKVIVKIHHQPVSLGKPEDPFPDPAAPNRQAKSTRIHPPGKGDPRKESNGPVPGPAWDPFIHGVEVYSDISPLDMVQFPGRLPGKRHDESRVVRLGTETKCCKSQRGVVFMRKRPGRRGPVDLHHEDAVLPQPPGPQFPQGAGEKHHGPDPRL